MSIKLRTKDETANALIEIVNILEKATDPQYNVKFIQADWGGEFCNKDLQTELRQRGIQLEETVPISRASECISRTMTTCNMPKNNGKGKAQRPLKRTASAHDLRTEQDPENLVALKFVASVNFTEVADRQAKTNSETTIHLLKRLQGKKERRNRSINQFAGALRDMAESTANRIETITLFEEPFLDVQRSEVILGKVWRNTERDHLTDHP